MQENNKRCVIHVRVSEDINLKLKSIAEEKEITVTELIRIILRDYISNESAENGIDKVTETIRRVIRSELQPVENRMAKLSAKGAVAAATSMYLNVQALNDMGLSDPVEKYEKSRKKAVAYLRMNTDDEE